MDAYWHLVTHGDLTERNQETSPPYGARFKAGGAPNQVRRRGDGMPEIASDLAVMSYRSITLDAMRQMGRPVGFGRGATSCCSGRCFPPRNGAW